MVQASGFFDRNSEKLHSAGVALFDWNSEKERKSHKVNKLLFDQIGFPVHLATCYPYHVLRYQRRSKCHASLNVTH